MPAIDDGRKIRVYGQGGDTAGQEEVIIGTSRADADMASGDKIVSFATNADGQNGQHVTKAYVDKDGNVVANNLTAGVTLQVADATHAGVVSLAAQTLGSGVKTVGGLAVNAATVPANGLYLSAANTVGIAANTTKIAHIDANGLALVSGGVVNLAIGDTSSYLYRISADTIRAPGHISIGGNLVVTGTALLLGALEMTVGDTTGTPGSGTSNTSCGKSSIAMGQTTCVITTNRISTGALVLITPIDTDACFTGGYKAVAGATSFTLTTLVAAAANAQFSWLIIVP
jgi:hypothetical protein